MFPQADSSWGRSLRRWRKIGLFEQPKEAGEASIDEIELHREVREIEVSVPEVRRLVERMGFSPLVERRAEEIFEAMEALIHTEIPDFEAFAAALESIDEDAWPAGPSNPELLAAVREARTNPRLVLELLNRDPVGELLPYIEEIPCRSGEQVVWRSPVEVSLISKRPTDAGRFQELLEEAKTLVGRTRLARPAPLAQEALASLSRLRRNLGRSNAYLPTPMRAMEQKVHEWLSRVPPTSLDRRRSLHDVVEEMLRLRREFEFAEGPPPFFEGEAAARFQQRARHHAQEYVHTGFLHTPWLTTRILESVLASELAPLSERQRKSTNSPGGLLRLVTEEVRTGYYDNEESIHRLRQLESRGFFVHSLVYALLRMGR